MCEVLIKGKIVDSFVTFVDEFFLIFWFYCFSSSFYFDRVEEWSIEQQLVGSTRGVKTTCRKNERVTGTDEQAIVERVKKKKNRRINRQ